MGRWNSKLLTLAEARKRRQCRELRGARRGRQRAESLCTPDLALAGHIHTHTPHAYRAGNKAIKVQHERKGATPQKTPQTGRASKCHRWNSKLLTLAEARKRRQCRELRGARRGRQRGESLCTPDLALAGHIHTHTPHAYRAGQQKLSAAAAAAALERCPHILVSGHACLL